jgi:hypothetical protein
MVQTILEDRSLGEVGVSDDGYGELNVAAFTGMTPTVISANVSFYSFNSNSNDLNTGNNRTFNQAGSPVFNSKGFFGNENIINFDGVDDELSYTADSFFKNTSVLTMGAWFKTKYAPSNDQGVISIGQTNDNFGAYMIVNTNKTVTMRIGNSTGAATVTGNLTSFEDGTWHHFAMSYDNTSKVLKGYVDGQLVGSATGTGNVTYGAQGALLGGITQGRVFRGSVTQFFYAAQVLTDGNILDLYSKRFSGAQVSAGHHLDADSFPLTSLTNKAAIYNLQANVNDTSGNGKNLTTGTAPTFSTRPGLFGALDAADFNGTTQGIRLNDSFFNVGTDSYAIGGWFAADDWTPAGAGGLLDININTYADPNRTGQVTLQTTGNIRFQDHTAGTSATALSANFQTSFVDGSWHHLVFAHDRQNSLLKIYVDGVLVASTSFTRTASISNTNFSVGMFTDGTGFFDGRINDAFFVKNVLLSDADILKLYSMRLDLVGASANVRLADRILQAKFQSEDGKTYNDFDQNWLLDQKSNKVYCNFGSGDAKVTLKCFDGGLNASVLPIKTYDVTFTATPGATIAHGLPAMPTSISILHNELADGKYVSLAPEQYVKADATNIYTLNFGSLTIDATHQLRIVASVGEVAAAFARDFSSNLTPVFVTKTATYTASAGDRILANTSGGAFTINLPPAPSIGDVVTIYDIKKTFDTNNLTVGRNGLNIETAAADLTLNVEGTRATLIYVDVTTGWKLFD